MVLDAQTLTNLASTRFPLVGISIGCRQKNDLVDL